MLCSACVVPSAPLLLPGIVPEDAELTALRRICVSAVEATIAAGPERFFVVEGPTAAASATGYGGVVTGMPGQSPIPGQSLIPGESLGAAVAAWLLSDGGWTGPPPTVVAAGPDVGASIPPEVSDLAAIGDDRGRVAALVLADLTAAATDGSPRPRDDVAVALSGTIADAVGRADIEALLALDPGHTTTLAIEGAAAFCALASAAKGADFAATTLFRGAPFGVEYIVAVWQRSTELA